MKKLLIIIALVLSVTVMEARTPDSSTKGVYDKENPHSLSVSAGSFPLLFGYISSQSNDLGTYGPYGPYPDRYDYKEIYLSKRVTSPVFDLSYSYRISRLLSVGCHFSYCTENEQYYGLYDDELAITARDHVFLLTPAARLHWLNRKRIELYSSFALGLGSSYTTNVKGDEGSDEMRTGGSVQFTPLGIAVKLGKTYIFGESGVGTLGALRFGVGHRF